MKGGEERERDLDRERERANVNVISFVISNELVGHVHCMRPLNMCHFNVVPPNPICSNSSKSVCSKSVCSKSLSSRCINRVFPYT